ncbi:zinc-ribbon domain-containing protein [Oceanicola sp. S124]|uniref:zinc-ribbon domain-containing protein n=1 Tax=Oceanicola sp. S124 TaxID=1042378 RepID=UPI0003013DA0|nr:zinc-ribbon domain-containing protein [Oceanicola sp. S124]
MRLTCPNCGAQYEVPDAVIPPAGRDVQCSNCGDTWFQDRPAAAADRVSAASPRVAPRRPQRPAAPAAGGDQAAPQPAAEESDAGLSAIMEESWSEDDDHEAAAMAQAPRRRELDPSVKEVLREEAEHEARVRAQESGGLESQPELGLSDPAPTPPPAPAREETDAERREREARARMARLRGQKDEAESNATSRRDLLPDIEEINSSLRSRGQKPEPEEDYDTPDPEARRSFRRGFTLPIFLAAIAVLVYVNAPRIAQGFPPAEPAMRSYVGVVDEGRVWLDVNVRRLIVWIEEKTATEA